jgi:hypothetical protein
VTHFWGYRIPALVVPVVLAYAVLGAWWVWRGRAHLAVTVERVLLGGAVAYATAVTMSPPGVSDKGVLAPDRPCAIHTVELGLAAVSADDQRILNVLLLVPVGVFAALVATRLRARPGLAVVALAAALPFAYEAGQQLFRGLQRACDTTDLVDNLTGVLLGLVAGVLLVGLRWAARRESGRVAP